MICSADRADHLLWKVSGAGGAARGYIVKFRVFALKMEHQIKYAS